MSYSDARNAATYRLVKTAELHPSDTPGVVSFREMSELTEERIQPFS